MTGPINGTYEASPDQPSTDPSHRVPGPVLGLGESSATEADRSCPQRAQSLGKGRLIIMEANSTQPAGLGTTLKPPARGRGLVRFAEAWSGLLWPLLPIHSWIQPLSVDLLGARPRLSAKGAW